LQQQLERIKQKHGYAVLYDCHSIRSEVPYLFKGKLPDFNIGTNNGTTCDPEIESKVIKCCTEDSNFIHVLNGRFKGGWTTRHYGKPGAGYHTIQMELAQCNYMREAAPRDYGAENLTLLRIRLNQILLALLNFSN